MKEMTLSEQLKAVNLVDEASQLSLLENCSNLHFLTLAYMAMSQSVKVRMNILLREELHVVVLKILEVTMPDYLKAHVINHKSYKAKEVDTLRFMEFIAWSLNARDDVMYIPKHEADNPMWRAECRMKEADVEWQKKVVYGGSLSHIIEMISKTKLSDEVIDSIIVCSTDDDPDVISDLDYMIQRGVERSLLYIMLSMNQRISEKTEALICCLFGAVFITVADLRVFYFVDDMQILKLLFPAMEKFAEAVLTL